MNDISVGEIKVRILEAIPLTFLGKNSYLLSIQIEDRDFISPIVRKELKPNESLQKVIREFIEMYKAVKPVLVEVYHDRRKY